MAEKETQVWPTYVALGLLALLLIGSFTWMAPDKVVVPSAEDIASKIKVTAGSIVDLSNLTSTVDEIKTTVNEDSDWESEALALAESEFSEKGYKAIFNVLTDIVEKEDIESVEVTDFEVRRADADDKDAKVFQELKVRYEDSDGDNKKVYLEVTTVIKDGEVDYQEITLA